MCPQYHDAAFVDVSFEMKKVEWDIEEELAQMEQRERRDDAE